MEISTESLIPIISSIKKKISDTCSGKLLYLTISGAHLYGFPSPDSDVDYRGCYLYDTNHILGLRSAKDTITINNPDIQLFELGKEIHLAL